MTSAPRPSVRQNLVFRPLADEWVVLDPQGRRLHVLNLSAAVVWGHLDGSRTEDDLAHLVWSAFGRSRDRARVLQEVRDLLLDFRRKGLLEPGATVQ